MALISTSAIKSVVSKATSAVKSVVTQAKAAVADPKSQLNVALAKAPSKSADVAFGGATSLTGKGAAAAVKSVASSAVGTAIGAAAGKVAKVAGAAVVSVGKAFVKEPVKTTAKAAGAIVVSSALVSSKKAREEVVKAPSNLATFGTDIGKAVDNPSLENIKKIGTDSPILTGLTAAGAALIVGKVAGTIATIENTKAIKESNEIAKDPNKSAVVVGGTPGTAKPLEASSLTSTASSPSVAQSPSKKQASKRKQGKRKAKINKCEHFNKCLHSRRCKKNGSATKCYNFY